MASKALDHRLKEVTTTYHTFVEDQVLTEKQLKAWGCKYHELKMNKPAYDLWIDDKSENPTK